MFIFVVLSPYFPTLVILDGVLESALLSYGHRYRRQAKMTRKTVLNFPIQFSMRYADAMYRF
jgi:hypothetical protein